MVGKENIMKKLLLGLGSVAAVVAPVVAVVACSDDPKELKLDRTKPFESMTEKTVITDEDHLAVGSETATGAKTATAVTSSAELVAALKALTPIASETKRLYLEGDATLAGLITALSGTATGQIVTGATTINDAYNLKVNAAALAKKSKTSTDVYYVDVIGGKAVLSRLNAADNATYLFSVSL